MKIFKKTKLILVIPLFANLFLCCFTFAQNKFTISSGDFKNPPNEYRPIGGSDGPLPVENLKEKLNAAYNSMGFGGYMWSPSNGSGKKGFSGQVTMNHPVGLPVKQIPGQSPWVMIAPPGTKGGLGMDFSMMAGGGGMPPKPKADKVPEPEYLSKEYFDLARQFLSYTKETGHKAVFYDEVGFPSGSASHTTPRELYRKVLDKSEEIVKGTGVYTKTMPEGVLMAAVAMNESTLQRIDLTPLVKNNILTWKIPEGEWKVMIFNCHIADKGAYDMVTDFLDPEAVQYFVNKVYEPHYKELGEYFGNTIFQTFWDDVGIFDKERTWTFKFNERFKELTGKDPAIYYPALWENIGPETEAARAAFFNVRAELLADGFPKVVSEWCNKHNIQATGHAPGNYEIQPVDMCADPFKYDRAQPIPMVDVVFAYPYGRDGAKLASDGGDFYDKPVTNAETFAAFLPGGTKAGYRRAMELNIRGINRFTGAGLGRPLIGDSALYGEWAGRTSLLMQGGRRVSEIAIFYPIDALEAFFYFDAPEYTKEMRVGSFVPYETDYMAIGEMLLNQVHRDFTFVHPDFLLSEKMKVNGKSLDLVNKVNAQSYKVLILPGEKVISIKALEKIKSYYDAGGAVIATSLLPSKASELPSNAQEAIVNDKKVQAIIKEMFGIDSDKPMPEGVTDVKTNTKNGKSVFINTPSPELLTQVLDKIGISADVAFEGNPTPSTGGGAFSYVHKVKDGKNIYLMANSTDDEVNTYAELRGKIKPEMWDPYTGETSAINDVKYIKKQGHVYTRVSLKLDPVKSTFIVGK